MTASGLHDILLVAATALPVLYVPVVIMLLDRHKGQARPIRPFVMLMYALVFVNAELPALVALGTYGATDTAQVGADGLLLLAGVGTAMMFGLILTFGPAADLVLAGAVTAPRRSLRQWLALAVIAIVGVALPVASSVSYLHFQDTSTLAVLVMISVTFIVLSILGAILERTRTGLVQFARGGWDAARSILSRRVTGTTASQDRRNRKPDDAEHDDADLQQNGVNDVHIADSCPVGSTDSVRARSSVNQDSSANPHRLVQLARQTGAALTAIHTPSSVRSRVNASPGSRGQK